MEGIHAKIMVQIETILNSICFRLLPDDFQIDFNDFVRVLDSISEAHDKTIARIRANPRLADSDKRRREQTVTEFTAKKIGQKYKAFIANTGDKLDFLQIQLESGERLTSAEQIKKTIQEGEIRKKLSKLRPEEVELRYHLTSYPENRDIVDAVLNDPVGALVSDALKQKMREKRDEYFWKRLLRKSRMLKSFRDDVLDVFYDSIVNSLTERDGTEKDREVRDDNASLRILG